MPRTRFVRSREEISRLLQVYAAPAFLNARSLSVTFETDPEIIAESLPPPLEPGDSPVVSVSTGHIGESNCVGPFGSASVMLRARYRDIEGSYCLTMPMGTDAAVVFGRELYGEPKKVANISLHRQGDRAEGTVERYGITYITLRAELREEMPAGEATSSVFHYKFTPAADGKGLDHKPLLIHVRHRRVARLQQRGRGEVIFSESPNDPVADLPVRNVLNAAYFEGDIWTTASVLAEVDEDAFLPYMFGKMDLSLFKIE